MPRLGREQEEVLLLYEPYRREIGVPQPEKVIMPISAVPTKPKPVPKPKPAKKPLKIWTEQEFERETGVEISPDLPKGTVITGYKKVIYPKRPHIHYEIEYYEPEEATFQETLFEKYPHLAFGAVSIPGIGVPPREYPITKRIEHIQQAFPIPGVQQIMVAGVGAQEWLTGPSPTKAVVTTAFEAVTARGLTTKHFEELKEYPLEYHIGTLGMDIFFAYTIAEPVGKVVAKATKVIKKIPGVTKATSVWERHITEPVMKRLPEFIQKRYYGPEWISRKAERTLVWEKKPFVGYQEFYLQIERPLVTKVPAEKWYTVFRGEPITPMKTTLERAIGGAYLGRTQQVLVTQFGKKATIMAPTRLFEPALKVGARTGLQIMPLMTSAAMISMFKLTLKPTARVREIQTGKLSVALRTKEIVKPKQILRFKQITKVEQELAVLQIGKVEQLTKQLQKQKQQLAQLTIRPQLTKQAFKTPKLDLPREFMRKKRKRKPIGEEWFYKTHLLMTPKEMAKTFGG